MFGKEFRSSWFRSWAYGLCLSAGNVFACDLIILWVMTVPSSQLLPLHLFVVEWMFWKLCFHCKINYIPPVVICQVSCCPYLPRKPPQQLGCELRQWCLKAAQPGGGSWGQAWAGSSRILQGSLPTLCCLAGAIPGVRDAPQLRFLHTSVTQRTGKPCLHMSCIDYRFFTAAGRDSFWN